jgi:hypothetical protein
MSLNVESFTSECKTVWDNFIPFALQGTFLHSRKYLSFSEDKFIDKSLFLKDSANLIGLFPAAQSLSDKNEIISHPGITYGGVIHSGKIIGQLAVDVWVSIIDYYKKNGFKKITYKAVPKVYHKIPCDDDLYALFRIGASRVRTDLSSAINVQSRHAVSKRRQRCLSKAQKSGASIKQGINLLNELWPVLEENLARKHNARPVHGLSEIKRLAEAFPSEINCTAASIGAELVAGVVTFDTKTCLHAQYIASSEAGYDISALDLIFDFLISEAEKNKKKWFNFGISTENDGMVLNSGLYNFKSEFGGGGVVHEHYQINL